MADNPENGRSLDRRSLYSEHERLLTVYRGWKRAGRHPMRFSWRLPKDGSLGFVGAAGLLLFQVTPVDAALWSERDADLWSFPLPVTGPALLWALLLVCLLNCLLFHRLLSRKTPSDLSTRWQLLALRCFVSGLPLLGWVVFPAWGWLLRRRPAWMFSPYVSTPEILLRHNSRRPLLGHWMGKLDESLILLLALNNSLLLVLASHWIQVSEPESPDLHWWPGLLYSFALHLLMFAGTAWYLRIQIARSRTSRLRSLSLLILTACLLPPIPVFSILAFFLFMLLDPSHAAEDTLAHALIRQRGTTHQLPVWWELKETIQRNRQAFPWRKRLRIAPRETAARPQADETQRHVRLLLRRKTLFLVPDTIAFKLAVPMLAGSWPRASLLLDGGLSLVGLLSLPLLITGLAVAGVQAISRRTTTGQPSRLLDLHSFGTFLARTEALYFLGLLAGHLWRHGQMEFLENLFLYIVAAGLSRIGLKEGFEVARHYFYSSEGTVSQEGRAAWDGLRQIFFITGLAAAAGIVLAFAQLGLGNLFVTAWLPCSLLWGARLARTHLPWLLRPSPGQPFPESSPGLVAFIRITAVLPLGGLAVPLWLLACRRPTTAGPVPPPLPASPAA